MEQILIYLGILIAVGGICFGGIYLKKKYNIQNDELEFAKMLVKAVSFVASKTNFAYKGELDVVGEYVLMAIEDVEKFETFTTIKEQKEFVMQTAYSICEKNGIKVDKELEEVIKYFVDYFVS
jgi:hypothetical protein